MAFEQAGGRGVPGAVGAGGSEDVRAAADKDDAAGTEGPAGRRPEHPHRPDLRWWLSGGMVFEDGSQGTNGSNPAQKTC